MSEIKYQWRRFKVILAEYLILSLLEDWQTSVRRPPDNPIQIYVNRLMEVSNAVNSFRQAYYPDKSKAPKESVQ